MAEFDTDVLIVGGGPVGATLALALAQGGYGAVTVLEAQSDVSAADGRILALSEGSRLILEAIGIWHRLPEPTPITRIHVSERQALGRAWLTARQAQLPALGYVVDYAALRRALHEALTGAGLTYRTGARVEAIRPAAEAAGVEWTQDGRPHQARARLLAVADGGRLLDGLPGVARSRRDYGQWAVVCQVGTERPHGNVAYERFTAQGPLALLPYRDHYGLVWTASPDEARAMLAWDDAAFLARLGGHFGERQGRFLWAGPRSAFPLGLARTRPRVLARTVIAGNAAQTLHPVAGQGFNLGLRDAWELSRHILATPAEGLGTPSWLAAYEAGRRLDTAGGILFTDALVRLFSNDVPGLRTARAAALSLLDVLPPVKDFVVRRMVFGARG